jgi:hypothetical protein
MIQSNAENMKKILEALLNLPANYTVNPAHFTQIWPQWRSLLAGTSKMAHRILFILSPWHCIKMGIKNGFTFALQFFLLIFDGLGGVLYVT